MDPRRDRQQRYTLWIRYSMKNLRAPIRCHILDGVAIRYGFSASMGRRVLRRSEDEPSGGGGHDRWKVETRGCDPHKAF